MLTDDEQGAMMTSPGGRASVADGTLERAAALMQGAFDTFPEIAARLVEARTTVCLRTPHAERGVVLHLAEDPPRATVEQQPVGVEVHLTLDDEDLMALAAGAPVLHAGVIDGRMTCSGPLRKLLQVSAVLETLLADAAPAADRPRSHPVPGAGRDMPEVPGDFWAMRCSGLVKEFGTARILRGIDLGIPEGLVTVVLGPSGTGKSVLVKLLCGLLKPTGGQVHVRDHELSGMTLAGLMDMRRKIGVMFQDGALWGSMNVFDNVALPLRQHTNLTEDEVAQVVYGHLARVGLTQAAHRMPGELSGGMRKRAGFARALVLDPEIVLVDEPDSGLDPVRTRLLAEVITETHGRLGGTYLVVTHDMGLLRAVADYIIVLWKGQVVEAGLASAVLDSENPFVRQFVQGGTVGPLGME